MSAVRTFIQQSAARGVRVELEDGELVLDGDVSDELIEWARARKAEIIAELRGPKDLNALLDEARVNTSFTLKDCKTLFSPLDLNLLVTGELTMVAARHFLGVHHKTVCRKCLGCGCKECDHYGSARCDAESGKSEAGV